MNATGPKKLGSSVIEAPPSPEAQTAVRRLAARADRARVLGRREEADVLLLQAWAAYDA